MTRTLLLGVFLRVSGKYMIDDLFMFMRFYFGSVPLSRKGLWPVSTAHAKNRLRSREYLRCPEPPACGLDRPADHSCPE